MSVSSEVTVTSYSSLLFVSLRDISIQTNVLSLINVLWRNAVCVIDKLRVSVLARTLSWSVENASQAGGISDRGSVLRIQPLNRARRLFSADLLVEATVNLPFKMWQMSPVIERG